MKTKTVGQASYELLQKPPEKINVIDLQREMQKSIAKEFQDIILKHKNYAKKYYILLQYLKVRPMPNVIRQQFIVRKTRPSPNYDCSLFSYNNDTGELDFHWTVPDEDTCTYLLHNKNLRDEEKQLYGFVKDFVDGKLK